MYSGELCFEEGKKGEKRKGCREGEDGGKKVEGRGEICFVAREKLWVTQENKTHGVVCAATDSHLRPAQVCSTCFSFSHLLTAGANQMVSRSSVNWE